MYAVMRVLVLVAVKKIRIDCTKILVISILLFYLLKTCYGDCHSSEEMFPTT